MKGWNIGYIRVSTVDQNSDRQLDGIPLDKLFEEKVSAKNTERPKLKEMLGQIRQGDAIFVHDISRLARNIEDLHRLVRHILEKGCSIHFVKENLHFDGERTDPTQELLLSMLGAVYQFERSIILERQREGIAKAKERGAYKGRPQSIDRREVLTLIERGLSFRTVAHKLGISLSSVQRITKEHLMLD